MDLWLEMSGERKYLHDNRRLLIVEMNEFNDDLKGFNQNLILSAPN